MSNKFKVIAAITFALTISFGLAYFMKLLPFQKDYYSAKHAMTTEGESACKNNSGVNDIAPVQYHDKYTVFCNDGTMKWISKNKPSSSK